MIKFIIRILHAFKCNFLLTGERNYFPKVLELLFFFFFFKKGILCNYDVTRNKSKQNEQQQKN